MIAFDELKTDYKNPIDQCNNLNPVSSTWLFLSLKILFSKYSSSLARTTWIWNPFRLHILILLQLRMDQCFNEPSSISLSYQSVSWSLVHLLKLTLVHLLKLTLVHQISIFTFDFLKFLWKENFYRSFDGFWFQIIN